MTKYTNFDEESYGICAVCGRRLIYLPKPTGRWFHVLGHWPFGDPYTEAHDPVPGVERRSTAYDTEGTVIPEAEARVMDGNR